MKDVHTYCAGCGDGIRHMSLPRFRARSTDGDELGELAELPGPCGIAINYNQTRKIPIPSEAPQFWVAKYLRRPARLVFKAGMKFRRET